MDGKERKYISPGKEVDIVLKEDQSTGKLTRGVVKKILTNSENHPRGIKVILEDGSVGRVQNVVGHEVGLYKCGDNEIKDKNEKMYY